LSVRVRESLQLQTTTGSNNENLTARRHALGKQEGCHLMKRQQARNLSDGTFGIASDGLRIGE
jgi:hypothetical protein